MWSVWLVFCDYGFHSVCSLMNKDKRLMEASWWGRLTVGKTGSCSDGHGELGILFWWLSTSRYLIQFSTWCWGCVLSLLFGLRPNCWPKPPNVAPGHSQASLTQSLVGTLILSPGSWCAQGFVGTLHESVSPILWKFCNQIPLASNIKFPWGSQSLCRIPGLGNLLWVLGLS